LFKKRCEKKKKGGAKECMTARLIRRKNKERFVGGK